MAVGDSGCPIASVIVDLLLQAAHTDRLYPDRAYIIDHGWQRHGVGSGGSNRPPADRGRPDRVLSGAALGGWNESWRKYRQGDLTWDSSVTSTPISSGSMPIIRLSPNAL
jgi:hypothetical protein